MTIEHGLRKERTMRKEWGYVITHQGQIIAERWGFDTRGEAGIEAMEIKAGDELAKVGIGHRYVTEPEEIP